MYLDDTATCSRNGIVNIVCFCDFTEKIVEFIFSGLIMLFMGNEKGPVMHADTTPGGDIVD
jgi:hypothetical protein